MARPHRQFFVWLWQQLAGGNSIPDGLADIAEGLRNWRIWHLMGTSELRRRYSRSRLGQFWLTLSTAITVVTLGLVWSQLWKMAISDMMPFFAISYVVWMFFTAFLTEASTAFMGNSHYFTNQRMTFSTVIYALCYRNLITLAHNLVIVVAVLLFFAVPVSQTALLSVLGLVLAMVTGFAMSYLIAMVCLRYRDLVQLVSNMTQVIFFITPVLWQENTLPPDKRWFVDFNPFAVFLSIIRDPLLGIPVAPARWVAAVMLAIGSVLLALAMIGRFRRRIIYWI